MTIFIILLMDVVVTAVVQMKFTLTKITGVIGLLIHQILGYG